MSILYIYGMHLVIIKQIDKDRFQIGYGKLQSFNSETYKSYFTAAMVNWILELDTSFNNVIYNRIYIKGDST